MRLLHSHLSDFHCWAMNSRPRAGSRSFSRCSKGVPRHAPAASGRCLTSGPAKPRVLPACSTETAGHWPGMSRRSTASWRRRLRRLLAGIFTGRWLLPCARRRGVRPLLPKGGIGNSRQSSAACGPRSGIASRAAVQVIRAPARRPTSTRHCTDPRQARHRVVIAPERAAVARSSSPTFTNDALATCAQYDACWPHVRQASKPS